MAIKEPPEEQGPCGRYCIIAIFFLFAVGVLTASILLVLIFASMEPQYYAAIDAVSDLDPATRSNLSKPALDQQVEFNLTLGVRSRSPFSRGCLDPGAIVTVTYLGVQVADGSTSAQACAAGSKPEQMVRMPVVARATREGLPVLQSLAADERRGLAVLDVSLRIPPRHPCDDEKLVVCRDRRVGGVVFEAPCDEQTSTGTGAAW